MTREEIINEIRCLLSELDNGEDAVSYLTQNDVKWLNENIKALEQELCEDEYIKVPKKALKYRTAGMVAYNAEWLKNHFDIERAVICGVQEPILDKIRAEIANLVKTYPFIDHKDAYVKEDEVLEIIDKHIKGVSE